MLLQGPALGPSPVDCGAMCMPGLAEKVTQLALCSNGVTTTIPPSKQVSCVCQVQALVDDAVSKGAKVTVGGKLGSAEGQFFQPTVLVGVTQNMKIWHEEVFGPVLAVIKAKDDEEVHCQPRPLSKRILSVLDTFSLVFFLIPPGAFRPSSSSMTVPLVLALMCSPRMLPVPIQLLGDCMLGCPL